MNSLDSVLLQLSSQFLNETSIPTHFLYIPIISQALARYKWIIQPSHNPGWTILVKQNNYSS